MNPLIVYDFLFVFRMQFAQTVGMMILDNSCSISDCLEARADAGRVYVQCLTVYFNSPTFSIL